MRRFSFFGLVVLFFCARINIAAPPATAPAAEVNLIAMGDWGTNGPNQKQVADAMASYVEKQARPFDAVLLAGDNFYVTPEEGVDDPLWQTMFEKMYDIKRLPMPFYVSLGNHDYQHGRNLVEAEYSRVHPESRWKYPGGWFRVDMPKDKPLVSVLLLDSNKDVLGKQKWQEQMDWIEAELSKPTPSKWTIAVAHHPLFSNGDHGDNGVLQVNWGPMFKKHNLSFYVCGHDHDLQHLEVEGFKTTFILCGGGGGGVRPMRRDNRGPFTQSNYGFVHLKLTSENASVSYIDRGGGTLHAFGRDLEGHVTNEGVSVQKADPKIGLPR